MNGKISTAAVIIISCFTVVMELILSGGTHYNIVSVILAVLAILPYVISHGNKRAVSIEIRTIISVTLISVVINLLFSASFFRPVTSVTIIAGMFFGSPAGFICGTFSVFADSLLSGADVNTVFKMTILGITGFIAGIFSKKVIESNIFSAVLTLVLSFAFSFANIFSTVWNPETGFDSGGYLLPYLKWFAVYAVSDVIVLLVLKRFFKKKAERMKKKFRIFEYSPKKVNK